MGGALVDHKRRQDAPPMETAREGRTTERPRRFAGSGPVRNDRMIVKSVMDVRRPSRQVQV
jgi:hypothetical protein